MHTKKMRRNHADGLTRFQVECPFCTHRWLPRKCWSVLNCPQCRTSFHWHWFREQALSALYCMVIQHEIAEKRDAKAESDGLQRVPEGLGSCKETKPDKETLKQARQAARDAAKHQALIDRASMPAGWKVNDEHLPLLFVSSIVHVENLARIFERDRAAVRKMMKAGLLQGAFGFGESRSLWYVPQENVMDYLLKIQAVDPDKLKKCQQQNQPRLSEPPPTSNTHPCFEDDQHKGSVTRRHAAPELYKLFSEIS